MSVTKQATTNRNRRKFLQERIHLKNQQNPNPPAAMTTEMIRANGINSEVRTFLSVRRTMPHTTANVLAPSRRNQAASRPGVFQGRRNVVVLVVSGSMMSGVQPFRSSRAARLRASPFWFDRSGFFKRADQLSEHLFLLAQKLSQFR